MDILDSLTHDFDHLRELTIDLTTAEPQQRERYFRELVRFQDVTVKAQANALNQIEELEFAKRKMLERCDTMEEIAMSVARSRAQESKDAKMDLYADLTLARIRQSEREILPSLYEVLSAEDRSVLAHQYEKYRDIALNHDADHPHAV